MQGIDRFMVKRSIIALGVAALVTGVLGLSAFAAETNTTENNTVIVPNSAPQEAASTGPVSVAVEPGTSPQTKAKAQEVPPPADPPPALSAAGKEEGQEPVDPYANMTPEERLRQPVSLDLRNIDVTEALKFVSNKGGLNIIATKNVSGRVTLTFTNVALQDVFDVILRSNSLAYVKRGDIYEVMTEAEYKALYGKGFFDIREVKMFRLKYAIPEQAFPMLEALKSEIGRVIVDQESGNVLLMDTPERIRLIQDAMDDFEKKNTVEIFTLKYARAKDVQDILKTRLDAKKVGSIAIDERNNQIIVQTLPERMREVRDMVISLDKPTKQVLIEAKIVKIKLSDQMDESLEWEGIFEIAKKWGTTYVGSYPFSYMTAGSSTTPAFQSRYDTFNKATGVGSYPFSGTATGLAAESVKKSFTNNMHLGVISTDRDVDALMNYINTLGKARVLANPKLVVVNNQEAKIHIGEKQAYVTTTTTTGQTTSTISEEVTFVDVGIQLSVTPTINDDGFVTMKIKPEISSVSSVLVTPTNNRIPIIDTSLTETTVMMKDGTTILIGGMRKDEKTHSSDGTPGLSGLPLVGKLFKTTSDKTERTELLVMITPRIISGSDFTMGDDRNMTDNPGKDAFQSYEPVLKRDEDLPPQMRIPPDIQPKPYREYLGAKEKEGQDEPLLVKGKNYELN